MPWRKNYSIVAKTKRRRKSTPSSVDARLVRELKPKRITAIFPDVGDTSFTTRVNGSLSSVVMANGHEEIGLATPNSISDVFGTLELTGVDGATDSSSLFEASGHDVMNLIYDAYRVYACKMRFRFTFIPDNVQTTAFTDTDGTGGDTSGTGTKTSQLQQRFQMVVIPSAVTASPATNWYEVMHHPFAWKTSIVRTDLNSPVSSSWGTIEIDDCAKFIRTVFRHDSLDMGQELEWIAFAADPIPGQLIHFHVYLVALDSQNDKTYTNQFKVDYTMKQWALVSRHLGDDTDIMAAIGDIHVPTVTG